MFQLSGFYCVQLMGVQCIVLGAGLMDTSPGSNPHCTRLTPGGSRRSLVWGNRSCTLKWTAGALRPLNSSVVLPGNYCTGLALSCFVRTRCDAKRAAPGRQLVKLCRRALKTTSSCDRKRCMANHAGPNSMRSLWHRCQTLACRAVIGWRNLDNSLSLAPEFHDATRSGPSGICKELICSIFVRRRLTCTADAYPNAEPR